MWLRRAVRWAAGAVLAAALLIQVKQVDHSNPPVHSDVEAPPNVEAVLRRSCYDCHSHETRWPWYSYVAPTSWIVAHDVTEGRDELNFSDWPRFDDEEQEEWLEEIEEQVLEDAMPLPSYRRMHPEARLTEADRKLLLRWTRGEVSP